MKITRVLTYEYQIDDETLKEYLNQVKPEIEISFTDFIDWLESIYYLNDFEECVDDEYEQINNNYKINKAFLEEIKRLNND